MKHESWDTANDLTKDRQKDQLYRRAQKRVYQRLAFYQHFAIYLIVNAGLLALDILNGTDHFFVQWVIGGWGIGVLFHFLHTFALDGDTVNRWTEREYQRLANRAV